MYARPAAHASSLRSLRQASPRMQERCHTSAREIVAHGSRALK